GPRGGGGPRAVRWPPRQLPVPGHAHGHCERPQPLRDDGAAVVRGADMIRIAVVEDDERSRGLLVGHLRRYEEENGLNFEVSAFADGRDILAKYRPIYDVVLLDIQMEYVDGMTAAKRIREVDPDVV